MCGTFGKLWKEDPNVFRCPNCASIFSEFGIVIEAEKEDLNFWN
jgi:hypothetical protein